MALSPIYHKIAQREGIEHVRECIENATTIEVIVEGVTWHVLGDMSAVSTANDELKTLEHIHAFDGYVSPNHNNVS